MSSEQKKIVEVDRRADMEEFKTEIRDQIVEIKKSVREFHGETVSSRESVNANSRHLLDMSEKICEWQKSNSEKIQDVETKVDTLSESIKDFVQAHNAWRGVKTFGGWIKDTVKYLSIVSAGIATIWYVIKHGAPPPGL